MQVEEVTSLSLHEPEKNIKIGVNYLSKLIDMFENLTSALHAYNVGPSKVKKIGDSQYRAFNTGFTKKVMNEYQTDYRSPPRSRRRVISHNHQ